ncbi:hypothetical protein QTP70_011337 [Hemibagrus guttatus]|uniref:Protocadherin-9 n=1 Tax=Hemibagrus guttatus TaxID=175788 RepID=A0AAE0VAY1_9TELE|nr:hypothetical protein QTP70_011337 [Hemibagrus guttatus]
MVAAVELDAPAGFEKSTPEGEAEYTGTACNFDTPRWILSSGKNKSTASPSSDDSRPLPDVAMTGKCTRECDEYGHSDACWMPVRTSPERRPKATPPKLSTFNSSSAGCSGAEPATSSDPLALANGEPSHLLGDRNRNLLNKKMASSSSSSSAYEAFGSAAFSASEETSRPVEEIPLAPTGEYKPTQCGTLTRREVYL